jgi:branched-chain amino acid aminotransferase
MLDLNGFVAETNATNIFMIKNGAVFTPFADACLPGITRGLIIKICRENKIPIFEKNISVTEFYNADQVFTTGTMGELAQVIEIDKRQINNNGRLLNTINSYFKVLTETTGEKII